MNFEKLKQLWELWSALTEKKRSWSKVIVAAVFLALSIPGVVPKSCEQEKSQLIEKGKDNGSNSQKK